MIAAGESFHKDHQIATLKTETDPSLNAYRSEQIHSYPNKDISPCSAIYCKKYTKLHLMDCKTGLQ